MVSPQSDYSNYLEVLNKLHFLHRTHCKDRQNVIMHLSSFQILDHPTPIITKKFLIGILILIYLFSRVYGLTTLPIYLDEGLHIERAIAAQQGDLWLGAEQGKWLGTLMFTPFVGWGNNIVWTARLGMVVYGLITLLTCYLIGQTLFSPTIGLWATLMYVVLPFVFFYNRLALVDGAVSMLAGWIIFFSIKTVQRSDSLYYPILLTLSVAAIIFTKISGTVFLAVPVAAAMFLPSLSDSKKTLVRMLPAVLGGIIAMWLIYKYNLGFGVAQDKQGNISIQLIIRNTTLLISWLWHMLTPPLTLLLIFSISWAIITSRAREEKFLIAILLLVTPFLIKAEIFFPRYILFVTLPICLFLARGLASIKSQIAKLFPRFQSITFMGVSTLLIFWPIFFNITLTTTPVQTNLPPTIRNTYLSSWSSGYGITDAATFLNQLASSNPNGINLIKLSCWDHANIGLPLYLSPLNKIQITTIQPSDTPAAWAELLKHLSKLINQRRTIFVYSYPPVCYSDKVTDVMLLYTNAQKIWSITNPNGEQKLELWELMGVK